jgi:cysteine synthase A
LDSIDRSIRVTDQEAVDMAHWILRTEGLWMGSSSAMNLVGAVKVALSLPPGANVVTVMCDAGQRHATRFWNPRFIQEWGCQWPDHGNIPECLRSVLRKEQ